jgi:uncharacterized protein
MLMQMLCPQLVVERVEDLDIEALRAQGFRGMVFDLDNTLVSWRRWNITPKVRDWLAQARSSGFRMCILSNCMIPRRVRRLSRLTGLPALPKANKPSRKSFQQALDLLETQAGQTLVIGDQVFTDVLGGNRMGLYTILVRPIERREFYFTILSRTAENLVLARLIRQGLLREEAGPHGHPMLRANLPL